MIWDGKLSELKFKVKNTGAGDVLWLINYEKEKLKWISIKDLKDQRGILKSKGEAEIAISVDRAQLKPGYNSGSVKFLADNADKSSILLTVKVTGNSPPTDMKLSTNTIFGIEGSEICTISTEDPDTNDTFKYSFVVGEGSENNDRFEIRGNKLLVGSSKLNEARYSIRIKVTDKDEAPFAKDFTLFVKVVNRSPYDITVSNSVISRATKIGATIAALSTTDADKDDKHTYELLPVDDHNSFEIRVESKSSKIESLIDFSKATQLVYSLSIRTKTVGKPDEDPFTKSITLKLTDDRMSLTPSAVIEHKPINTSVGNIVVLGSKDPYKFTLVAGSGGEDNDLFTVDKNTIRTLKEFDFEKKSDYKILVKATTIDKSTSYTQRFTIKITDGDDPPSSLKIGGKLFAEGVLIATRTLSGSSVGSLSARSTSDVTYSLPAKEEDNDRFTLQGEELKTNFVADFTKKNTYKLAVVATNAKGLSIKERLVISVSDKEGKSAPSNISLTLKADKLYEIVPVNTVIGTLSAVDRDNDPITFSIVPGEGGSDNDKFSIDNGTNLILKKMLDYETRSVYGVLIQASDGLYLFKKALVIRVTNIPEPPKSLTLTPTEIKENQPAGSIVGSFSTTSAQKPDTYIYELVSGEGDIDNAQFEIIKTGKYEGKLLTKSAFDYEVKEGYSVRVRVTGRDGFLDKSFTITVSDVKD